MKFTIFIITTLLFFGIFSCNEQKEKQSATKIIQEQDSLLKILDEQDSLVIISNDSLKIRTVKPDSE